MIKLGSARESDVVLAFLRAEPARWHNNEAVQNLLSSVGVTNERLIHADFQGDYAEKLRACVLDKYRGYLRKEWLFNRFPNGVVWRRVELEPADFGRLMYIANEEHWDSYSQRTRSPQVVADRMARRELPDSFAQTVTAIQDKLKRSETLPELVAVEGEGDKLILIEGAHRITAYVGLNWPANIPAIVGRSTLMPNWHWYKYRS
jgi:hypothetical protein